MKRTAKALPAISILSLALLTACGGGTPDSADNNPSGSNITLAGKVIDGYIEGATVCLDLNANLACDSGEPTATTKADGSYSLDVSSIAADKLKAAHLLTTVPTTAKDADDGGKTMAEAGKSSFSLLAPVASYVTTDGASVVGAVISPLTTLVSHEMISSGTQLLRSENYVRERLNIEAGLDIRQDFVANKNAALSEKAQMLTAAIGTVQATALADTTSKPTDKQALLAALTYLQTEVANLQTAYNAAKAADSTAKPAALVKTALATDTAKPDTSSLVAEARKITDTAAVTSVVAALEQGFYGGYHVLETCSAAGFCTTPSYWNVKGTGGNIAINRYDLVGTAWAAATNSSADLELTSAGWVPEQDCSAAQSMTYAADGSGSATITFCNGRTEKISARQVDAAGKTLAALGLKTPAGYEATTMPSGSTMYWLDFASPEDSYFLYTGDGPVTKWVPSSAGGTNVPLTTVDELVSTFSTDGKRITGWSGLIFSFNTGGTSAGGTVTLYSDYIGTSKIGTAIYERRLVHNKEVLVIKAPAPQNKSGELVMFSANKGQLFGGSFRSAASKSNSEAHFNKAMMNGILAAGKKPSVLN